MTGHDWSLWQFTTFTNWTQYGWRCIRCGCSATSYAPGNLGSYASRAFSPNKRDLSKGLVDQDCDLELASLIMES